ncbi:extracellular solute-binding protein [Microbacteriaceae bacterium VKM Ac-2855]|nr:extracellular solute-binding protein [Microbacteriaceae bacterium VKM Ac-2855]
MTWEHPRGYDCQVATAAAFGAAHPQIEVRWEKRSLQAFADAPLDALAAEYDLLVIDHPHVPLAAENGWLAPLDGAGFDDELAALAAESVGRSHASYRHLGRQWGLATDAAAHVAAYRPDLLAEPPRDWAAVLDLAREGRVLWPAKPIDAFSSLASVSGSHGASPHPQPGVWLAESDALAALDILHELAAHVPTENLGHNPIQVAEMLADGDQYAYAPLLFGYTNYSRPGFRPHRLRYIDMPAGSHGVTGSLLAGAGVAVSAFSAHPDEARRYAFYAASDAVQAGVYYDAGGQPGYAHAWDDDRLNADAWDFFRGTRASLECAWTRPRTAGFIEFQDTTSPWVTAALRGELTDADLVTRMNDAASRLL